MFGKTYTAGATKPRPANLAARSARPIRTVDRGTGTEGQPGPITDQTAETYNETFDTNVLGVILSMKHQVRAMQEQGSGGIVNISSTHGHEGAAGASVYVGSKHAVEAITKSVALEVASSGIG
jgi:NADP-dependent 3-hydroxy acid dehydrogenase YdfG